MTFQYRNVAIPKAPSACLQVQGIGFAFQADPMTPEDAAFYDRYKAGEAARELGSVANC